MKKNHRFFFLGYLLKLVLLFFSSKRKNNPEKKNNKLYVYPERLQRPKTSRHAISAGSSKNSPIDQNALRRFSSSACT